YRQSLHRCSMLLKRAWLAFQMRLKLLAKLVDDRNGGHCRRIAQRTKRATQHVLREIQDVVNVLAQPTAGMKTIKRLLQPVSAFAARNAPATALMLIIVHNALSELHHAG